MALAGEEPAYSSEYRNDPYATISPKVKAVVGVYGVYDMQRQWEHDQIARPRDQIAEKFLGASPMVNRKVFFEGSPISYATVDRNTTRRISAVLKPACETIGAAALRRLR